MDVIDSEIVNDNVDAIDAGPVTEVRGTFTSQVYPKMIGSMSVQVSGKPGETEFAGMVRFRYDTGAPYSAGKEKAFPMIFVCDYEAKRVSATMRPGTHQMITLTISFSTQTPTAYYSSVYPIDCGAIKLLGNKSDWAALFNMHV